MIIIDHIRFGYISRIESLLLSWNYLYEVSQALSTKERGKHPNGGGGMLDSKIEGGLVQGDPSMD